MGCSRCAKILFRLIPATDELERLTNEENKEFSEAVQEMHHQYDFADWPVIGKLYQAPIAYR